MNTEPSMLTGELFVSKVHVIGEASHLPQRGRSPVIHTGTLTRGFCEMTLRYYTEPEVAMWGRGVHLGPPQGARK